MKKILSVLLSLILMSSMVAVPKMVFAGETWIFKGNVVPKYALMKGDYPTENDFIIDGVLTNGVITYQPEDLCLGGVILTQSENNISKFITSVSSKDNPKATTQYTGYVEIVPFDKTIVDELNESIIEIDKISKKSNDGFDTIYYYNDKELRDKFKNPYGKIIPGELNIKEDPLSLKFGYNTLNYKFTPSSSLYNSEPIYGKFYVFYNKVNISPKKNAINIGVNIKNYRIFINGKEIKKAYADNLKPNTKYKVVIKQKNTPKGKNVTIWSGTVKTKK